MSICYIWLTTTTVSPPVHWARRIIMFDWQLPPCPAQVHWTRSIGIIFDWQHPSCPAPVHWSRWIDYVMFCGLMRCVDGSSVDYLLFLYSETPPVVTLHATTSIKRFRNSAHYCGCWGIFLRIRSHYNYNYIMKYCVTIVQIVLWTNPMGALIKACFTYLYWSGCAYLEMAEPSSEGCSKLVGCAPVDCS